MLTTYKLSTIHCTNIMTFVRVPGKVILFGEHAVVYGKPALAVAIEKYVYVRAKRRSDEEVHITANDLTIKGVHVVMGKKGLIGAFVTGDVRHYLRYILKAIEIAREYSGVEYGIDIEVKSEMPVSAGLGTSASISIGVLYACLEEFGINVSKEELARLGWRVEREVQGAASPTDTATVTHGGYVFIQYEGENVKVERLDTSLELPLIIGYVPRKYTTKEMVEFVRKRLERLGRIGELILDAIESVTLMGRKYVLEGDLQGIGELMYVCHGLLAALGVSTRELDEIVHAAKTAGALGAKLTGAGGGGCVIALGGDDVLKAVKAKSVIAFRTNVDFKGAIVLDE